MDDDGLKDLERYARAEIQLQMSRSNLIFNIASLINEGAISIEYFDEFSN